MKESSRGSSIWLASNKTPSSPPSSPGSKIQYLPEDTRYDKLSAGSGDDYYSYPFFIDGDLHIGEFSGVKVSINIHTLFQQNVWFHWLILRIVMMMTWIGIWGRVILFE